MALTTTDFERLVRDWLAAHILRAWIVLLRGERLWDYPTPVPTWDSWGTWPTVDPIMIEVRNDV